MSIIYELKEYSIGFSDCKYSSRKPITFTTPKEVIQFIKQDDFYGDCLAFNNEEYENFHHSEDDYIELIDPLFECVADCNLTIEDLEEDLEYE